MTPQENKNMKIGAIVLGVAIAVYFATKSSDNGGEGQDPTGNADDGGGTLAYDANQVRLSLFHAMNQVGTDEDKIIQTLRTVTATQFAKVITAFGQERYSDIFGYKTATATPRDLLYWLNSEMSDSSEYANLQRKFKQLY